MENFTRTILNNAQTSFDGGDIGNILRHVRLLNNSQMKAEVMFYFTSLRLSGGYVAGLIFGLSWIFIMMFIMIFCCYKHFKQSPMDSKRNRVFIALELFKLKKRKKTYSNRAVLQLFALGAIIIPVLLLLCLSIVNVVHLSRSISEPANNYEPNKTDKVSSILPALKKSLWKARCYLSTFSSRARIDTASTVEDIIVATKTMQNETMTNFNRILMGRIGVTENFRHGDEMTRIIVMFFDLSMALLETRREYEEIRGQLYPAAMDPGFGVFRLVSLLRDSISQIPLCDEGCVKASTFFARKFVTENHFADTDFASSFLFVMRQRNETKESVKAKSAHGRLSMAETMGKTKKRMESLVDIRGTIQNMTSSTWTKMDVQFQGAVASIDRVLFDLSKFSTDQYSFILVLVLLIPLFLSVLVVILTVSLVFNGARSNRLRLALYANLSLLSIALVFAMLMFLIGGKFETELCRYLRTEQPVIVSVNGSRLMLDNDINVVLGKTLESLPKTGDFPIPSPHNVLYGIVHKCRNNEPILAAISAIDSIDARALSKPEASEKIVAIGRMLMIESLNETDPRKMMPSDMEESLKQVLQMDMFKKIDIDANIAKIPRSPILEKIGNITVPVPRNIFIDRIENFITIYGPFFKDQNKRKILEEDFRKLLLLLERFNLVTDKARQLFKKIENIPKIEPVVRNLQRSLVSMLTLMNNKTKLLAIADKYYEKIIVKTTPENTAGIMVKFGPKMMGKLGHCRPLFDAYQSSVNTACDVIVAKFNTYWLYLGTIVLLLTIFLSVVLLTLVRTTSEHMTVTDLNLDSESKKNVSKPLCELPNEDPENDTIKTIL